MRVCSVLKKEVNSLFAFLGLMGFILNVAGCSFSEEKDQGDASSNSPYAFTDSVRTTVDNVCSGCHMEGPSSNGYLDFIKDPDRLVIEQSIQLDGSGNRWRYVVPGDPSQSLIYLKVSSGSPPIGARMPQGGQLTPARIQAIYDWIANMPPE